MRKVANYISKRRVDYWINSVGKTEQPLGQAKIRLGFLLHAISHRKMSMGETTTNNK